jgi:hypothetical protein
MSGLSLARAGSLLGLGIGVVFAWRLAVVHSGNAQTGLLWGMSLGVALMAPFLLAYEAISLGASRYRGTVCVGTGVAGLLLMFSSLAGVALVLFIPAIMLISDGVTELQAAERSNSSATLTFFGGPVAAVILTLAALFAARASLSEGLLLAALALWASLAAHLLFLVRREPVSRDGTI